MSAEFVSRFSSQKPEDIAWRVNAARVDSAIEGMERDTILAAYLDKMKAAGASTDERRKFLADFDLEAARRAAE